MNPTAEIDAPQAGAPRTGFAGMLGPIAPDEPAVARLRSDEIIEGQLTRFDPESRSLSIRVMGGESVTVVFAELRSLKLTRPVDCCSDAAARRSEEHALELVGGSRPFAITFDDGVVLAGELRGYGADASGFGLYLTLDRQCERVFVPSGGVANVAIGERIGTLLLEQGELSADGLELALERQRGLRQQKLGSLLLERAMVTRTQLEKALEEQSRQPVKPLGEVLVDMGIITRAQLNEALDEQRGNRRRPLGAILVEHKLVDEAVLHRVLAQKMGIPYVDLAQYTPDPNWADLATYPLCRQYGMVPLYRAGDKITVALDNPLDLDRMRAISFALGAPVVPVLASSADIAAALEKHPERRLYESIEDGVEAARAGEPRDEDDAQALVSRLAGELPRGMEPATGAASGSDSTLVKLVNKIILDAHRSRVSDIHIEPGDGRQRVRVRFRRDGVLHDYLTLSSRFRAAIVSRIKIMANLDISERRQAQDGKIDMKRHAGVDLELRVAIVPTHNGVEAVVIRLLAAVKPMPLADIGLAPGTLERLRGIAEKRHGLILVSGPTGSGKTTTLHSLLAHLNTPETKIWTAEDPIEITQAGLTQVQVQPAIGWTFATALRAFLRADPDIIMVGEVRDAETARIAVEASLTGHLVLTTLHTNSAAESATRLIDIGIDPFNFADALLGVLAQRLARRVCTRCRKFIPASDEALHGLAEEYCAGTPLAADAVLAQWRSGGGELRLAVPTGCRVCHGSGYSGRIALYELMVATPAIKRLLLRQGTVDAIASQASHDGMRTLRQDGIEKVLQGLTTIEQVRAVAS